VIVAYVTGHGLKTADVLASVDATPAASK